MEDLTEICSQCKGEGVIPDPRFPELNVMCPTCEGEGWVWLEADED